MSAGDALPQHDQQQNPDQIRSLTLGLREVILNGGRFQQGWASRIGLSPTGLAALGYVYLAEPLTPGELALRLGRTPGSVTPLVDRLLAAGYVTREDNPADRRSTLVQTTTAGHETMERFYAESDAVVRQSLDGLPNMPGAAMNDVLQRVAGALKEHPVT